MLGLPQPCDAGWQLAQWRPVELPEGTGLCLGHPHRGGIWRMLESTLRAFLDCRLPPERFSIPRKRNGGDGRRSDRRRARGDTSGCSTARGCQRFYACQDRRPYRSEGSEVPGPDCPGAAPQYRRPDEVCGIRTWRGRFFADRSVIPARMLPDAATLTRFSDEQLFALALYIYSLQPPRNPNSFDEVARRGQKVFEREGCAGCHTRRCIQITS